MKSKHSERLLGLALLSLFIFGACMNANAQERGHSSMGGHGTGGHSGMGSHGTGGHSDMGSHGKGGVNRGSGAESEHSNGRSDRDMDRNSGSSKGTTSSMGRSGADMDRARKANKHAKEADEELSEHPSMANGMNMSANQLRSGYQAALATNPNLKFGQFVAATRIAQNLRMSNPNITTNAILQGLASGKSLGQTLQGLGLSATQARTAIKTADEDFEESEHEK